MRYIYFIKTFTALTLSILAILFYLSATSPAVASGPCGEGWVLCTYKDMSCVTPNRVLKKCCTEKLCIPQNRKCPKDKCSSGDTQPNDGGGGGGSDIVPSASCNEECMLDGSPPVCAGAGAGRRLTCVATGDTSSSSRGRCRNTNCTDNPICYCTPTTPPTTPPTIPPTPPPPPCPVQPRKVQCIAQTTCDNQEGSVLEGYTCTGTTVCCDLPPAPSPPDKLEIYTCPYVQTYDADVHAQGGIDLPDLTGDRKLLDRDIGVEGIVSSKDETYDYLSQTQWSAKTDFTLFAKDYIPYQLIKNKIKTDGDWDGAATDGYYTVSGTIDSLTLNPGDVLVLLADNNTITIEDNITINGDESFFLLAVNGGDIEIDPSVTQLHGIYYTEGGTISTGSNVNEEHGWVVDNPLTVRGQFIGKEIEFERNLRRANDDDPAEVFYYKPSLSLNAPPELMVRYTVWEEVTP